MKPKAIRALAMIDPRVNEIRLGWLLPNKRYSRQWLKEQQANDSYVSAMLIPVEIRPITKASRK